MTYRNPEDAFDQAISERRLSANPASPRYAGNFMYMGTADAGRDLFKHINSRQYLP